MLLLLILILANSLSKFPIKGKLIFSNAPKSLAKNLPDCLILCVYNNWVYNNFIIAGDFFAKALQSLGICLLVNNNLCGK